VLSDKLKNQKLTVIDDFALESHRTKEFLEVLKTFDVENKVLVVDDRENRNLYLSSRNVPQVKCVATLGLNVYDLLNWRHLLISKRAILNLQEVLKR
jgi:large subunit ribosomal protein L4